MNIKHFISLGAALLIMSCSTSPNTCFEEEVAGDNFVCNDAASFSAQGPNLAVPDPCTSIQKVIRRAWMDIEVEDFDKAKVKIDSITKVHKAYTLSNNFEQDETRLSSDIEIKVTANSLDSLITDLTCVAKKVNSQNISTNDVTEKYIDIQAQIQNKQKVERTFIKLLNKATTVDEILKIQTELGKIRAELESVQGRMKYLDNQVSLSSISLHIYQQLAPQPKVSFWNMIKDAIKTGCNGAVWFVMFIISTWPIWVVAIATIIGIRGYRTHKRQSKRKQSKKKGKGKKMKKGDGKEPLKSQSGKEDEMILPQ